MSNPLDQNVPSQSKRQEYTYELMTQFRHVFSFLLSLTDTFQEKKHTAIHNERNVLKVIPFGDDVFVVKSFKDLHIIRRLIYTLFRESKAKRSYAHSVQLGVLGVSTPAPVGYIEFFSHGLVSETYYVARKVDFDYEFRALLDGTHPDIATAVPACAKYVATLHNLGVLHVDLSPGNILVTKQAGEYIFDLVDVNRMKFTYINDDAGVKNITRLLIKEPIREQFCTEYAKNRGLNANQVIHAVNKHVDEYHKFRRFKKFFKGMLK